MASAVKELSYRSFDEMLDAAKLDLTSYNQSSDMDPAMLIKIAQKINYELGLRIYMPKETIVEIVNGRAKLPADFHQLQLALLCYNYQELYYPEGPGANGCLQLYDQPPTTIGNPYLTTCPCWRVVANNAQIEVTYCDGTRTSTFFPANSDGSDKVTNICAQTFHMDTLHGGTIAVTTSSFCYNDPVNSGFTCTAPAPPCAPYCTIDSAALCGGINGDPWGSNLTRTICDGTKEIKVIQGCGTPGRVRCYETFSRMYIVPNRNAGAFCMNTQFRGCSNTGSINGNFLETSVDCGRVYLNYMGGLVDDDGNLLVLDHPTINLYYEWAMKRAVLENLYLNGEDLIQRLQYTNQRLDEYRQQALSIANTADYRQCIKLATVNQNMNMRRYGWPIDSTHGYISWSNIIDNIVPYNS